MRLLEKRCVDCARVDGTFKLLNYLVVESSISKLTYKVSP